MTGRRRVLLMLASLTVHGGLVALLAVVSSTSLPSAIFIVLSELEPAAIATGPRQARASAGPPAAAPAPSRLTPPAPRPSPARSAPEAAMAPPAAPAPATLPEILPAPAPPRSPEPVSAVSAIREETVEGSSSGPTSQRGSELSRGGAVADASTGSGMAQRAPSAGGEGAGTNVALAPSGSRGAEPGAEYGSYLSRMRGRIQEALRYPPAARRRGLKGTVLVEILIRPDGAITGVSVTGSSSHRLLDDAALEAVRSLPPQPFPAGLLPRPLTVQLPVVFDLQ